MGVSPSRMVEDLPVITTSSVISPRADARSSIPGAFMAAAFLPGSGTLSQEHGRETRDRAGGRPAGGATSRCHHRLPIRRMPSAHFLRGLHETIYLITRTWPANLATTGSRLSV